VRIDLDGFEARAVALPVEKGGFSSLCVNDEGKLLYMRYPTWSEGVKASIHLLDLDDADEEYEKTVLGEADGFAMSSDGAKLLEVHAGAPLPLAASDLQFFASVHPAQTPKGFRLVQIDAEYAIARAERGRPVLDAFDAAAFGDPRLRPAYPVAASVALGDITLPRVRYVVRPDVLAFEGTEALS